MKTVKMMSTIAILLAGCAYPVDENVETTTSAYEEDNGITDLYLHPMDVRAPIDLDKRLMSVKEKYLVASRFCYAKCDQIWCDSSRDENVKSCIKRCEYVMRDCRENLTQDFSWNSENCSGPDYQDVWTDCQSFMEYWGSTQ